MAEITDEMVERACEMLRRWDWRDWDDAQSGTPGSAKKERQFVREALEAALNG